MKDNIVAGIGPNGFDKIYEIKILICYILDSIAKINQKINKTQLNGFVKDQELADYFMFNQALNELIETNYISFKEAGFEGEEKFLKLQRLGKETASKLKFSLPKALKEKVSTESIKFLYKIKNENHYESNLEEVEDGYIVNCYIHDIGTDLLSFKFFVPDKIQAQIVRDKFMKDPLSVYKSFLFVLTDDNGSLIELASLLEEKNGNKNDKY